MRVYRTEIRCEDRQLLLALDPEGVRYLLIPCRRIDDVVEDRRSRGVHVVRKVLLDSQENAPFLALMCRTVHIEIFSILVAEILGEVERAPAHSLDACALVLARWRALLEREPSDLLGVDALCGLFAELWHLRELVRLSPHALAAWKGPAHGQHDFRAGGAALEAKATRRREGRFFEIHGLEQLEVPRGGSLHLSTMKLEASGTDGESLPDIVEDILATGVDPSRFLENLASLGYYADHATSYRAMPWTITEARLYRVDPTFPRIVSGSFGAVGLPPGILSVSYVIDLSGEPPQPLATEELQTLHRSLASSAT